MINVVYLGTPQIAVNALNKLINFNDINMVYVITPNDKPQGRGYKMCAPCVKQAALKNNLKVLQTDCIRKDREIIETLKNADIDFFITFAFGQILSQEILDIPKYGTINLHASLLPKYRGANPIQRAILNGDTTTGITTMITSLELDEGDICQTEEIKIEKDMGLLALSQKISDKAPFLLYKTIKGIYTKTLTPQKQSDDKNLISYANKCSKEDMVLNFNQTTDEFYNKIRAFDCCGNAYFCFNNKKIKVTLAIPTQTNQENPSGKIIEISQNGVTITTKDNAITLKKIKPEGKGEMDACCWVNGARLKVGDFITND